MIKENEEIKKEFLKREEIRTMEKDIAQLRESEAQKEREKITKIEVETKVKKEEIEKPKEEIAALETLIPKLPLKKRPGTLTKILVRLTVLIFCLLILGFFYWFFEIRRAGEVKMPPEEITRGPEIIIPSALIQVASTKTAGVLAIKEIPEILEQTMAEKLTEGSFQRVVIKDTSKNQLISLEDLARAFQIEVPKEIFEKLSEDYTLAIFSQKEGKRIVLVTKVKEKTGLDELLNEWEKKISREGDSIFGEKISTLSPYFATAFWQEAALHYLTISKEDLGICYAFFDDYFVFTTSLESLRKVIGELKGLSFEEKAGQLLIVGFEGKIFTPQLENFFKKYKPGGVLLLSKNVEGKEQLKKLIFDLQNFSLKETGLPLFVAVDQEGEPMSRIGFLAEKTSQAKIESAENSYQVGLERGKELKELGINLNLAPVLDLMKSTDFYFNRTFQKSADLAGQLANSLILGQKAAGILTAVKHFPGYVGINFNPEGRLAIAEKVPEISQFKKAAESGPEMVMVSNMVYKEIDPVLPFTFSSKAIQFLKSNLGNEVLILSDDLAQTSLLEKFTLKEIVTKPIEAGVDILIFSGYRLPVEQGLDAFFAAIKNEEVSKEKLNQAISRIIQLKQDLLK